MAAGISGAEFTENDEKLFEKLRELRSIIAKEEKVPPYIVFSDKTLTHMCVVKPRNRKEMLSVSGVGEFKYEKYGERFLQCIREEMMAQGTWKEEWETGEEDKNYGESQENEKGRDRDSAGTYFEDDSFFENDDLYFTDEGDGFDDWTLETALAAWENGSEVKSQPVKETAPPSKPDRPEKPKAKKGKMEFVMTEELAEQLHYSDKTSLSDFVGQINDLRNEDVMKRLTIKAVEQRLLDEGILELKFVNHMAFKRVTAKGEEFGVVAETKISEKGNEYEVFYYTVKAQKRMVEWLMEESKGI